MSEYFWKGRMIPKHLDRNDEVRAKFLPAFADMFIKGGALCANPQKQEADHGNIQHGYEQL